MVDSESIEFKHSRVGGSCQLGTGDTSTYDATRFHTIPTSFPLVTGRPIIVEGEVGKTLFVLQTGAAVVSHVSNRGAWVCVWNMGRY